MILMLSLAKSGSCVGTGLDETGSDGQAETNLMGSCLVGFCRLLSRVEQDPPEMRAFELMSAKPVTAFGKLTVMSLGFRFVLGKGASSYSDSSWVRGILV